jgi:prevent-host-death family protein
MSKGRGKRSYLNFALCYLLFLPTPHSLLPFSLDNLKIIAYLITSQTSLKRGWKPMVMNVQAKTGTKNAKWQLQEAKAMFSEVIKASGRRPQIISVRGKETAVILSIDEYQKLVRPRQTFFEFIQASPLRDLNLELPPRLPEKMRDINL